MNKVYDIIAIIYMMIVELYVAKSLCRRKIIYKPLNFIILLFVMVFYYLNGIYNYNISKSLIFVFLYYINNFIFLRNSVSETLILTMFYYILGGAFELLFSIILFSKFTDITIFDSNHIVKLLYSVLIGLFLILIFKIPKTKKFLIKLYNNTKKVSDKTLLFSISLLFLAINIILINNAKNISSLNYAGNTIIFIVLFGFELVVLNQYIKVTVTEKNNEILLDFMIKYEKIIDDDKMNRHEMLNNLIILKNIRKENGDEFDKIINKLIEKYDNNKLKYINKIYKLPKGLKGVIYYKFYDMKESNINVNLIVNDECNEILKSYDTNLYFLVSKILGILLDNAKEASIKSDKKEVALDIYKENEDLVIEIINTIKDCVDIKLIIQKHYSSKGRSRGFGLYIVNKIIKKSKGKLNLTFQTNNNIFISKLTIKK